MTSKAKKFLSVLSAVLIAFFLLLAIVCLAVALPYKLKGEDAEIFGRQIRIVLTGSMEPTIRTDSLVCVDAAPESGEERDEFMQSLQVGDIITFYDWSETSRSDVVVTHRIVRIEETETGLRFICHGDAVADPNETQTISESDVIGIVEWSNYPLGKIISFLRTTAGIVLVLIVPAAVILVYEIFFILQTIKARKEEKKREEAAALEQEIERLRRELEELKTEVSDDD